MGLIKKDGYIVKGVKLQPAYAKIIWLEATTNPNGENSLNATFSISTVRENLDNGEVLGSLQNEECKIDSISQSWAAISGAGDRRCRVDCR